MEQEEKNSWKQFHRLRPQHITRRARRIELATIRHAHKFLIHRWRNVREVRRHMVSWLVLMALLITSAGLQIAWGQNSYLLAAQESGGTYAEGVVGRLETVNPIYATTSAERSASRLIFSALLSYDRQNQLRGDLATGWKVSQDGQKYTISLRKNVTWHDGTPFTAKDVVFTVDLIKNDESRSPYTSSWQSIGVRAVNDFTVEFKLPAAYAPFPHALTVGILPEHLLREVAPAALRENTFSTKPIGTGPFMLRNIQSINVEKERKVAHFKAFANYLRGAPKLDRFQLHTYESTESLRRALTVNEVSAASDLSVADIEKIDTTRFRTLDASINNGVYALFNTESKLLSNKSLRHALRSGLQTAEVRKVLNDHVRPLTGPILASQVDETRLPSAKANIKGANASLDKLGWKRGDDGYRAKKGQPLELALVTLNSGDYPLVAKELERQWKDLGVKLKVELVESDTVQQSVLRPRAYDILIYELALGGDPDVYAYWHSSQASQNGLNFANYNSPTADDALESARSRSETKLRQEKYVTFVQQWLDDAPAIPLYQAALHYATVLNVRSVPEDGMIIDDVDRYRAVEYWTANRTRLYETP